MKIQTIINSRVCYISSLYYVLFALFLLSHPTKLSRRMSSIFIFIVTVTEFIFLVYALHVLSRQREDFPCITLEDWRENNVTFFYLPIAPPIRKSSSLFEVSKTRPLVFLKRVALRWRRLWGTEEMIVTGENRRTWWKTCNIFHRKYQVFLNYLQNVSFYRRDNKLWFHHRGQSAIAIYGNKWCWLAELCEKIEKIFMRSTEFLNFITGGTYLSLRFKRLK
jgi:hypothetical protein